MTDAAPQAPADAAPPAPEVESLIPTITLPQDAPQDMGVREAARALAMHRNELRKKQSAEPEPVNNEPAAAQPQEHSEPAEQPPLAEHTTETEPDPEPELPPIEPPRSWTKEAKERFASLPRETQEYLSTRETERDREVRRSQNEAAEARKAIEAERQAVAQQRQQYEQTLPQLQAMLQAAHAGEFSDIKSMEDVQKLASEDPFRYAKWSASQQRLAMVQQEATAAQQRQQAEQSQRWNDYAAKQDQAFVERVPEMAKPESRSQLQKLAVDYLSELGFSTDEMQGMYNGTVIRDARIQQAILDGARYRQAQKAAPVKVAKPVAPVQRPGVSQPRVDPRVAEIADINKTLETGNLSVRDQIAAAARLKVLQAQAPRRRA